MRTTGAFLLVFAGLIWAQGPLSVTSSKAQIRRSIAESGPEPTLRADVQWVRIPVNATDGYGAPKTDLGVDDFTVMEDGVPQQTKTLSYEEGPVSLGIVFDCSSSMDKKLTDSRTALRQLFVGSLPEDEYSLVQFSDTPALLSSFTPDSAHIEREAAGIRPQHFTALYDAVLFAMQKMKTAKNPRKTILILSDGADNYSRYSESELRAVVQESDVRIFSIALPSFDILNRNARTLRRLSELSGGASLSIDNLNQLESAMLKMSRAMRQEYLLSYVSANGQRDGLYRRVEVKLARGRANDLHLTWRRGYYAAQE